MARQDRAVRLSGPTGSVWVSPESGRKVLVEAIDERNLEQFVEPYRAMPTGDDLFPVGALVPLDEFLARLADLLS